MPSKPTLSTRVTRQESGHKRLENALAHLAEEHAKTEAQFRETDRRIRELGEETDRRIRELGEETDRRIRDLVSAIGEFIRRNGR